MDIFNGIASGFEVVFQPNNLLYCLIGVVIGMLIGVLPGLGTVATISVLLPITFGLPPETAIIMIAGIFYGAQYGGTITSVLLRLPGEASAVVTTFDGYQMARRGRAGAALGIAAIGSFIGGTLAIVGLSLLAPVVAAFALDFGPPEYAVLALAGILLVSSFGSGSAWKCIVSATIGLLMASVGRDLFTGVDRFTLDSPQLADGIDFAALVMGLFGLGEVLYDLERRIKGNSAPTPKVKNAWITGTDWVQSRMAIARGTLIGFILGVLPGGGATLSSMVSYAAEKRAAKDPSRFGKGAIEGVAGPESANNAAATSSFIPLLTLGIPANATMAIIYGALLLQGIAPGPQLISEHPDVFWGVIDSMWIGNILLLIMSIPLVRLFIKILQVRASIMAPITVMIILIGAYSVRNSIFDLWIVIAFGLLGFLMKKFGFEPGPLVLAFVLGNLLETSFRQSLQLLDGSLFGFFARPISGTLLVLMIAVPFLVMAVRLFLRKRVAQTDLQKEYENA
ncbi:hypothetical protein NCCP1664_17910 [Zafaria cholistanensis]|uniref:DUF112 domain-containing protein n=1 Tax=Zafaria cholistanensis TaxID=1682741 RepID=A0A5A7NRB9_9MICC|nr:tripartite tricarboxylate transporter permease [Zafaria cholistanensis]GER23295.1 hypothetical protein NCCP1664_17910 [Zafaria cholistanensis]